MFEEVEVADDWNRWRGRGQIRKFGFWFHFGEKEGEEDGDES